jgi:NAD(P)H-dependent FMN reductase
LNRTARLSIVEGMPAKPRILAFAASARRQSLNRRFLAVAVQAVQEGGAEATVIDLNDFELPIYNADLEEAQGLPGAATRLVGLIGAHQGLLVASPEYNSMVTPLLKNTLDWCSRADGDPFEGKVAAVIAASPGMYGGIRSLQLAQQLLLKLGCHVVPGQCALSLADKAFDPEGNPVDPRVLKLARGMVAKLVSMASRLSG